MVLFEDEFSLSNTATLHYNWAIKGKQPLVVSQQSKRERLTGLGSVNPLTGQLTVSFAERGNYQSFKKHLKKVLFAYRDAISIIIYVDNVRYHHARKLNNFLEKHPKLQIRYLPAYSPDMNPVERVWWFMRKKITHNRYLSSLKERLIKFWQLFSACLKPNSILAKLCVITF